MAKKEKTFNYKLYALVAFLLVAALLACTTFFAVKQKYIAFDEEKLAVSYADTIAQKGDGYNAYTYTLSSKSDKYGDFIRKNYMYPIIYPGYSQDMDSKEFKELKRTATIPTSINPTPLQTTTAHFPVSLLMKCIPTMLSL